MADDFMFFHFHNLQDDFINYYQSTNKYRIDQVKLSKMSILHGAHTLHRRIQSIFHNHSPKGIVICAHLKHSKLHDFYIIAACLIYGYTIFHSNWHLDGDESLSYKLKITNCHLVILDDELDSGWMVPHVKYLKISDVYTQTIYNKSLILSNYLTLVDSLGKDKSDVKIQNMLATQTSRVSEIEMDDVLMITFTEAKSNKRPKAKMITFRDMNYQFKQLEALNLWSKNDILVVFITNPTYDWINSTVLYYSLFRPNVYIYFMQRYMSTYWKILWEANEHAKNVYLPLGKSYKIVNFLYPRQIEALFTLEEIVKECSLIEEELDGETDGTKDYSKMQSEGSSDDKEEFDPNKEIGTNLKISKSSKISSYLFGKKGILNNIRSYRTKEIQEMLKQNQPELVERIEPIIPKMTNKPQIYNEVINRSSDYIQKLHLKFSELGSVLSDYRVHFFLSGSQTDYTLTKVFAMLFRGKVPILLYGSCEISPFLSIASYPGRTDEFLTLTKLGANNTYNNKPSFGYYIGDSRFCALNLRVVRSISQNDDQFLVKCNEGEPGFMVCDVIDKTYMIVDDPKLFYNNTYLGLDDIGFYYRSDDDQYDHFFWSYSLSSSLNKDLSYPYNMLMATSKLIQNSICRRFGLNSSVVRVETVKVNVSINQTRVITVVELITPQKSDISQDIKSGFLKTWKSLGLFKNYIEPDEIRVIAIPWTYKGSINYPVLIVDSDSMSPMLCSSPNFKDVVLVLRASQYHKNDIVMYSNPNTNKDSFGRLTSFNTSDQIRSMSSKIPSGHCWIDNDNPRSDDDDSNKFGPIPLGLIKGYVLATVFPPSRAKLMIG